jgi:mannitol-1-/sugar-/sorbitol-6-phosphatase
MKRVKCKAILFDMDGTLVDSTKCVESIWSRWAERHGIGVAHLLAISHGRRTLDSLNAVAPHLDVAAEAILLDAEELRCKDGITAVNGAAALLRALPYGCWAVVTSASRALAKMRLECAGLPIPDIMVCSDDVKDGKPNPEGYLLAAELMGMMPDQCLVVEDTPAGINAARSAGMRVLALTTTFPATVLLEADCIADFRSIQISPGLNEPGLNEIELLITAGATAMRDDWRP